LKNNEKLQRVFVREMSFIIAGLLFFYYFLAAGAITQLNLVVFLFLWIAYCYLFWTQLEPSNNDAKHKKDDDQAQPRMSNEAQKVITAPEGSEDEDLLQEETGKLVRDDQKDDVENAKEEA
jgi:Ca2+/Na+ antiporter